MHHMSIDVCIVFVKAGQDCKTCRYVPVGTGLGKPGVHLCGPLQKPAPTEWVWV